MHTKTRTMQPVARRGERDGSPISGLVVVYASGFEELPPAFVFERDTVIIGREHLEGGFRIRQDAVSRMHARIVRGKEGWTLSDLGSRNGTLVNGRAVREVLLRDLDEVRIGDAIFKFVEDGADAYAPYRIDGLASEGALPPHPELVGGFQIRSLLANLAVVAQTELSILAQGETGTGKELAARAVHEASRRTGSFRALNCAAIPPTLFESELFGFKRGAFTGAHKDKPGLVQSAEKGTLFLDEVAELSLEGQAKLLRMIETHEVTPLGSTAAVPVDVRLVCATHRDLNKMVEAGTFRADLFARINGYRVVLPPLRRRKEDLYALTRRFLAKCGKPELKIGFPCMAAMCRYDWPFNVRELEAAIRRGVALAGGRQLELAHLPEDLVARLDDYGKTAKDRHDAGPGESSRSTAPSEAQLRDLLARHRGNISAVARELGKDRAQVNRWIQARGIDPEIYR